MKPYLFCTTTHRDIEHGTEYADLKACTVSDWQKAYESLDAGADYLMDAIRILKDNFYTQQMPVWERNAISDALSRITVVAATMRNHLPRCEERLLDLRLYDGDLKGIPKQFPTGIKTEGNGKVKHLEVKFPRAED